MRAAAGAILGSLVWMLAGGEACADDTAPPPSVDSAPPPEAPAALHEEFALLERIATAKGWSYLVDRLAADGLDRAKVVSAFADPRVPAFDGLVFHLEPRESKVLYHEVLTPRSVALARACREEHAAAFEAAEQTHHVSADVIAAILHVETRCGRNTGSSLVLSGLARLAMADEPTNLAANIERTATRDGMVDEDLAGRVRARAQVLDDMFYPEVRATFQVADTLGIEPLELTGSPSGAFGTPQFLPTSYQRYGEDGNGDGRVDLYDLEDAAASTARFLAANGWRPGLTRAQQRAVIWSYNRSDAYIDAVLQLADRIGGRHHFGGAVAATGR